MKYGYLLFILTLFGQMATAQSEGRKLLAHYPLMEHFGDITGNEDSIKASNVDFTEQGLFIDGSNPSSDSANIIMATIEALNFDDFHISLDAKIDTLIGDAAEQFIRLAFVGGLGNKWMNILLNQRFGLLFMAHSTGGGVISTKYKVDEWYQFGLSYNRTTRKGQFYIDGKLAISDTFDLAGDNNKVIGLGTKDGRWPMKGHWKNLKIYGTEGSSSFPVSLNCIVNALPTDSTSEDGSLALEILGGVPPYHVTWNNGDTILYQEGSLLISNLSEGRYEFLVSDSTNMRDSCGTNLIGFDAPIAGRKLLAHFPLDSHFRDITDQQDILETSNVNLTEEGLFIDGADPTSDTSNLVKVFIDDLDLDDFYISLEVKLDSVPDDGLQSINLRHILVGGLGWKWMRAIVNQEFDFITLATPGRNSKNLSFEFDKWYTLGLYYDRKNLEGRFYLDGRLEVIIESLDLRGMNDKTLGIGCNCGPWPMKGHWKNFMVYGPDNRIPPLSIACFEESLPSSPQNSDGKISLNIVEGMPPYKVSGFGRDTLLLEAGIHILSNLGEGTYTIQVVDNNSDSSSCITNLLFPETLPLIAHYPLMGDVKDVLGLNEDLIIENIEVLDSAIYIDGADSFSDTANSITTNRLEKLNFDHFQIDLDFNLDSISGGISERIIILGGFGNQWITLLYDNIQKELRIAYNHFTRSNTKFSFEFNRWYSASIYYNRITQELSLRIDGKKIDEIIVDLEGGSDNQLLVDCKCGPRPMKGFWKDLKVYSALDSSLTSNRYEVIKNLLKIYPNPGSSHVTIESNGKAIIGYPILWYDSMGRLVKKVSRNLSKNSLTFSIEDLDKGIYWIKVGVSVIKYIKIE